MSTADVDRLDDRLQEASALNLTELGVARLLGTLRATASTTRRFNRIDVVTPADVAVVVLGAPRSGTTATEHAVERSGVAASLQIWESLAPLVPHAAIPRVQSMAQTWCDERAANNPLVHEMHPVRFDDPTEDFALGSIGFREFELPEFAMLTAATGGVSQTATTTGVIEQIWASAAAIDTVRRRRVWMLKRPQHVFSIPEIFDQSPQTIVALCVRDPYATLGSIASFVEAALTGSVDDSRLDACVARAVAVGIGAFDAAIRANAKFPGRICVVRADEHQGSDLSLLIERIGARCSGQQGMTGTAGSTTPKPEPMTTPAPTKTIPSSGASTPFTYDATIEEAAVLDRYVSTFLERD